MLILKVGYAAYIVSEETFGSFGYYLRKDGTLDTSTGGVNLGWWRNKQEAQQFLDNWLPQKEWLTEEEVQKAAKKSEEAALLCSIEHWKQVLLDVEHSYGKLGIDYCSMCKRNIFSLCKKCIVCDYKPYSGGRAGCCKEYDNFYSEKTTENAIAMYNRLVKIYNKQFGERKMSDMINIDGVEVSKDTIKNALDKAGIKLEKEYKPAKGDVCKNYYGCWRILVNHNGINSFDSEGYHQNDSVEAMKTIDKYEKVCTIQDLIDAYKELNDL